jgi:hypothetical protein
LKTTTRPLAPGENLVYRLQRSRHWSSLLLRLAVDALILFLVWRLFNFLNRSFIESYIRPWSTFGSSWLIAVNLFLSLVPMLVLLALVQDFLYTFFTELSLTDRRIVGRVGGLVWLNEVNLPLEQVKSVRLEAGHLSICRVDGPALQVYGFSEAKRLVDAYSEQQLGPFLFPDEALELPDAFTFQHVR